MTNENKQPLLNHLKELRRRGLYICLWLTLGFLISFALREFFLEILLAPLEIFLSERAGELIFIHPMEEFFVSLRVSFLGAVVISSPLWFLEIWRFVSPGLYEKEKRWMKIFFISGWVLFFGSGYFVQSVVVPNIFHFLMNWSSGSFTPFLSVSETVSFIIKLFFAFAVCFEIPLFLLVLIKLQILSVKTLSRFRGGVLIGLALLSAFFTPPDILSMFFLLIPLYLLFELSLFIGKGLEKI